MSKQVFNDEIELKTYLDTFQIRYGDKMAPERVFIVYFLDNKGDTIISRGLYTSPIVAIRQLPEILKAVKLPVEDVAINLIGVLDEVRNSYHPIDVILSEKIYFKPGNQDKPVEEEKSE